MQMFALPHAPLDKSAASSLRAQRQESEAVASPAHKAEVRRAEASRLPAEVRSTAAAEVAPERPRYPPGSLLRVSDICGRPAVIRCGVVVEPAEPGLLPISSRTWWTWVAAGKVPAGRKLGTKTTAWPIEDVLRVMQVEETEGA